MSSQRSMGRGPVPGLSDHRGMASLGVLLSVSIVALLYCTLVVLPAMIEVRERWRRRKATGGA